MREELWTVLGEELSQRSALAAGLLRMGGLDLKGLWEGTPLATGRGGLKWEIPAMKTLENYVRACCGKGVIQAKRYPGKEGPWFGVGMSVSQDKGCPRLCETSSSRPLFSPVLPVTPPRLIVPRFLEVGTSRPVDCTLDGLFPASEAQVQLALGDQMLNSSVSSQGDTLTATATATASTEEGAWEIVCNVTLGGESREIRENLTIYSKNRRGLKQL